jgi:Family of unknown function (DUF6535)
MLTPAIAQKSSENEMWNLYLNEVKEDDQAMADVWKQDAKGILVFVSLNLLVHLFFWFTGSKTGLFSATVGSFIIEFYKKLLPDPNSNTANQPFSPHTSMIWVNALWLISLVLSVTSALLATLLQQWARGYVETPKSSTELKHRARVRSLLFRGAKLYKISLLVEILPTLLHLSVYLFFGGLMITFHTINKKVAIAVDASAGLSGLAYVAVTILPCIDVKSPFRTPISKILWYPWHAFLFFGALCLQWIVRLLHGLLVQPGSGNVTSCGQSILVDWLETLKNSTEKQGRYLKDGLGKSIVNHYSIARGDGDHKMVISLFSLLALGDKNKFLKFAASIPRDRVLDLIPPIESLREPLVILLRSCAASTGETGSDEDVRKRCLLVCLDAIHYITKAPIIPGLFFVRVNFANIGLMRALWRDSDATIRVISRSICALIAKQVLRKDRLEEAELRWLQEVTGETSNGIFNAEIATQNRMNLSSFVYGVLSYQVDPLSTEDALCFKETLAILLNVPSNVHSDMIRDRLSEELGWIRQYLDARDTPRSSRQVIDRLLAMF